MAIPLATMRKSMSSEAASLIIGMLAIIVAWLGYKSILAASKVVLAEAVLIAISVAIHEISHRNIARRYGCISRYVLDPLGLILTLLSTFSPYLKIIVPGYVLITCPSYWGLGGRGSKDVLILATIAGPLSNIVLGIIFRITAILVGAEFFKIVFLDVSRLNGWLAFFNLLPVGPLDGARIFRALPVTWALMFVASLGIMIL